MKGTVKAYSSSVKAGVINGDDGKYYLFHEAEWSGPAGPVANQAVTFTEQSGQTKKVSGVE